mmetsp:Transcript_5703/g.17130  ORF Transcript_5703/g.17130 Transcript_5703/m.17130 type:complete len:127 (-) Transcript_5703:263-643(-)
MPQPRIIHAASHQARRLLSSTARIVDDVLPMTIADRVEAEAVRRGTLAKLSGRGKPLKEERESQAHIGGMPKNMEARAEAEMRRAERSGMLKNLGGEGAPLEQRHVVGAVSQQRAIQNHMQKETLR